MGLDTKTTYADSGVNYNNIDPFKLLCQRATLESIKQSSPGFLVNQKLLGSSSFGLDTELYKYMFTVEEQLGTKALITTQLASTLGPDVFKNIAQDTVATIVNDLICSGAFPVLMSMNISSGSDSFFSNESVIKNFIHGWLESCFNCDMVMGPGETAVLSDVITDDGLFIGGNCIGFAEDEGRIITGENITHGNVIICLSSNGVHANGISLIRELATQNSGLYHENMGDLTFGEAVLKPSPLYSPLILKIAELGIEINYISHITGHGLRKIMRHSSNFNYVIEDSWNVQPEFDLIQRYSRQTFKEMCATYNMGIGMVLVVDKDDVDDILNLSQTNPNINIWVGGYVESSSSKKVTLAKHGIVFDKDTLQVS